MRQITIRIEHGAWVRADLEIDGDSPRNLYHTHLVDHMTVLDQLIEAADYIAWHYPKYRNVLVVIVEY